MIAEGTLAIEMAAVATDLAMTIHAHPTLAETVMESAEGFFGHATHVFRPKKKWRASAAGSRMWSTGTMSRRLLIVRARRSPPRSRRLSRRPVAVRGADAGRDGAGARQGQASRSSAGLRRLRVHDVRRPRARPEGGPRRVPERRPDRLQAQSGPRRREGARRARGRRRSRPAGQVLGDVRPDRGEPGQARRERSGWLREDARARRPCVRGRAEGTNPPWRRGARHPGGQGPRRDRHADAVHQRPARQRRAAGPGRSRT